MLVSWCESQLAHIAVLLRVTACGAGFPRPTLRYFGARPLGSGAESPVTLATAIQRPGLPNLFRVNDDLYLGAYEAPRACESSPPSREDRGQPSCDAFRPGRDWCKLGLPRHQHISTKARHPEDEDVVRFLQIVTNPDNLPVFVHCQHGRIEPEPITAVYRIVVQGWTKDEAIERDDAGRLRLSQHVAKPRALRWRARTF